MSEMKTSEWIKEVYTTGWANRLTRIAEQKYGRILDAADLMEESRQRLALYLSQRCKDPAKAEENLSEAYIVITFKSRMTDVMRSRNGKPAPRTWLQAHGDIGKLLFELICLAHLGIDEIVDSEGGCHSDPLIRETPRELLLHIINEIAHKRECDRWERDGVSIHDGGEVGSPPIDPPASPGESDTGEMDAEVIEKIINILLRGGIDMSMSMSHGDIRGFAKRVAQCRERLGKRVALSDDQVYILRAFYLYGFSDKKTAEFLDLEVRSVRYQREKALASLELTVEKCGVGLPE